MTKLEVVEIRLLKDSHLSIRERIKLIATGRLKVKKVWKFNQVMKHILCKYELGGSGFFTHQEVVNNHADELDDLINHVISIALEVTPNVTRVIPNLEETDWIEYDHTVKGQYPNDYGKYLVARQGSKAIQFHKWGPERWENLSDNLISHFRIIHGPII